MSHPILERHLKQGALRPLYLFFGEEEFLMERALKCLESALEEQTGEVPHKVSQSAPEVGSEDFLAQARNAPLWGSGQILSLRRVETYPDQTLKAIRAYLDHPPPRTWVVLMGPGLKARDVGKHAVWSRLQKSEAALGFGRLKEEELCQWAAQEARGLGKSLTLAAARRCTACTPRTRRSRRTTSPRPTRRSSRGLGERHLDVALQRLKRQWGVEVMYVRRTAAGYMLEFRYRVLDAEKAKPLFERRTKPVLPHAESGAKLIVPTPAKTGALRNSNPPLAGHTNWMFFANPGKLVKPGEYVTLAIGEFHADGLVVQ